MRREVALPYCLRASFCSVMDLAEWQAWQRVWRLAWSQNRAWLPLCGTMWSTSVPGVVMPWAWQRECSGLRPFRRWPHSGCALIQPALNLPHLESYPRSRAEPLWASHSAASCVLCLGHLPHGERTPQPGWVQGLRARLGTAYAGLEENSPRPRGSTSSFAIGPRKLSLAIIALSARERKAAHSRRRASAMNRR